MMDREVLVISMILIILPIIFLVFFRRKWRVPWGAVMIGSFVSLATMLLESQLFYSYVQNDSLEKWLVVTPVLFFLIYAFVIGILEEIGRYLSYRFLLKGNHERKDGIALGIGYGGSQMILLGVLLMVLELAGSFSEVRDVIELIGINFLTPEEIFLLRLIDGDHLILSGFLLVTVLSIHIALSVLVLHGVREKKIVFLLLSIFLHIGVDVIAYLLLIGDFSKNIARMIICLLGILALYFIVFRSRALFYTEWDDIDKVLRGLSTNRDPKDKTL